jgi:hypothetical protein
VFYSLFSRFARAIAWLLSYVPFTRWWAVRRVRETVRRRLDTLTAQSQRRYPGAVALRLSVHGTMRNPRRSTRRLYGQMWRHVFGRALSGRQWVRLNKAIANGAVRGGMVRRFFAAVE